MRHEILVAGGLLVLALSGGPSVRAQAVLTPAVEVAGDINPLGEAALAGDIQGDGLTDFVVSSTFQPTRLLANDGSGESFSELPVSGLPLNARVLLMADLDGDGPGDLVYAGAQFNYVALGDGAGAFSAASQLPVGGLLSAAWSLDLDGDGNLDLLAHGDGIVYVLHGGGDGNFTLAQTVTPQGGSFLGILQLLVADIDEDGLAELIVTRVFQETVLFRGEAGGVFDATEVPLGAGPVTVLSAVSDVDDDGDPDLLWYNGEKISVQLGLPGFAFAPEIETTAFGTTLAGVLDMNRDGRVDVVVADTTGDALTVLAGAGNGRFTRDVVLSNTPGVRVISLDDLDGDGVSDLLLTLGLFDVGVVLNRTYDPAGPFADVGSTVPGVQGHPILLVSGDEVTGGAFRFDVFHAPPGGFPRLAGSTTQVNAPFFGGVLVPSLEFIVFMPQADGQGASSLSGVWPAALGGVTFTAQAWTPDLAAVQGVSGTTAVEISLP